MPRYSAYDYPNRLLCTVLDEMRKAYETRNFSYLLGLIEETQTLGNRMESGLEDKRDLRDINQELREKKKELRKLKEEIDALRSTISESRVEDLKSSNLSDKSEGAVVGKKSEDD